MCESFEKKSEFNAKTIHHIAEVTNYCNAMERVLILMNAAMCCCKEMGITINIKKNTLHTADKIFVTMAAFGFHKEEPEAGQYVFTLLSGDDGEINPDITSFIKHIENYCDGNVPDEVQKQIDCFVEKFNMDQIKETNDQCVTDMINELTPKIYYEAKTHGHVYIDVPDYEFTKTKKFMDKTYVRNHVIHYFEKQKFSIVPLKDSVYGFKILW